MDWLAPFACSFVGCISVAPTALAAAAVVDILRVRAEWWWLPIVLMFPMIGPLAYFAAAYGPWNGAAGGRSFSPVMAQRRAARRRLRELRVQIAHWRGPALLAEAGEQLLDLGQWRDAEAHLREAKQAGAEPILVNYPLAQLLQVRGRRYAEALPLLRELVGVEPDHRMGSARLQLARCLDETGDADGAERELREVLSRRNPAEARVRLARLLLRRGEGREAGELLAEVRSELPGLPRYLRRHHRPWAKAAARLRTGQERLPAPELEGAPRRTSPWITAAVVAAVLLVLASGATMLRPLLQLSPAAMMKANDELQAARQELLALDPGGSGDSSAGSLEEPTAAELDRYLEVRQRVAGPLRRYAEGRARFEAESVEYPDVAGRIRVEAELARHLADALRDAGLGPVRLERLTALVEWRFLGRDEAIGFAVPPHFRADWRSARQQLAQDAAVPVGASAATIRVWNQRRDEARAKVDDLEARARGERQLAEPTRRLLDERRPRIEALDPADLEALLGVLDGLRDGSTYWSD